MNEIRRMAELLREDPTLTLREASNRARAERRPRSWRKNKFVSALEGLFIYLIVAGWAVTRRYGDE
jgi:hypothetical protein